MTRDAFLQMRQRFNAGIPLNIEDQKRLIAHASGLYGSLRATQLARKRYSDHKRAKP